MTNRQLRVRALVREFIRDAYLIKAVEDSRTPTRGLCRACGHPHADLVIRDSGGVRYVTMATAEDVAQGSGDLVALCRRCGAVLLWAAGSTPPAGSTASRAAGWLWNKDDVTLKRAHRAAVEVMRLVVPPPDLPSCPHCGMRSRLQITHEDIKGTTMGRFLRELPVSFCTRCGGAIREDGGNLLPVYEVLDPRQELASDYFRAYGLAKALLESGSPARIRRALEGRPTLA